MPGRPGILPKHTARQRRSGFEKVLPFVCQGIAYNALLARSAVIMQEKMRVEFDLLRNQAQTLKASISKKYAELNYVSNNLSGLQSKLERLFDEDDIAETKLAYEKKQREFTGALTRDLKKLCWGFANQYYAYMTLSKNYYVYSDDMVSHFDFVVKVAAFGADAALLHSGSGNA